MINTKSFDRHRTILAVLLLLTVSAIARILASQPAYAAACVSTPVSAANLSLERIKASS